jgi:YD repeat-containing protein
MCTSISTSACACKDGNVKYNACDIYFPTRGAVPLKLDRSYDSFEDQVGEFGTGWKITPVQLRFPAYKINLVVAVQNFQPSMNQFEGYFAICVNEGSFQDEYVLCDVALNPVRFLYQSADKSKKLVYVVDSGYVFADSTGVSSFDLSGRLIRQEDRCGIGVTYTYQEGRLSKLTHDSGAAITIEYQNGRPCKAVGPGGKQVRYDFAGGHLRAVTQADGSTTSFEYDPFARLTAVIDPRGNSFLTAKYDVYNRAVELHSHKTGSIDAQYNLYAGRTALHCGRQVIEKQYDPQGRLTALNRDAGAITYSYGADGVPTSITDAVGHATQVERVGNTHVLTDALGGQVVLTYGESGDLLEMKDRLGLRTLWQRDAQGRVQSILRQAQGSDPFQIAHLAYDDKGDLVESTDELGHASRFCYDQFGRLIKETSPERVVIEYSYDEQGRLCEVHSDSLRTLLEYDDADHLNATTAAGIRIEYEHDSCGNIIAKTISGQRTSFEYDAANRLVKVIDASGDETRYSYDEAGNLCFVFLPNGTGLMRRHDALGRVVYETSRPEELLRAA